MQSQLPPFPGDQPNLLQKSFAIVGAVVLAGLALMFSAVLLVFLVIAGALAAALLWWKTRELRKQMQQAKGFPPPGAAMEDDLFRGEMAGGRVIEGEAVRVEDTGDASRR